MDVNQAIGAVISGVPGLGGVGSEDTKINKQTEANIAFEIATAISKLPFRRGLGCLFYFDGKRYEQVPDEEVRQIVLGVLYSMNIGKVYCFGSVSGIIKMVAADPRIKPFNPSKSVISFNNCMLRLSDMSVFPHDPEYATRIHLDYEYDPKASCPEWLKFLDYVIGDHASIAVLQEFLGLIFVDPKAIQVESVLLLYGTGANGKSTAQEVIERAIGKDYCSNYEFSQLCTHKNAEYNLADINGKLLNFASDMSDKDYSGGMFKALAARDPIQVRPIGQAPYKATELPLMIASVNRIPRTSDSTNGYWRRMGKIIHFDKTIPEGEQDRMLKPKLSREVSGVFNWIIEGRKRILQNSGRFTYSEAIERLVANARKDSNSVWGFLEENNYHAFKTPNGTYESVKVLARDLMKEYKDYCQVWGNQPKSKTGFLADMSAKGFVYRQSIVVNGKTSTGFELYKRMDNYSSDWGNQEDLTAERMIGEQNKVNVNELPF